ncbi:MAG TPA: penicillin acylase family protein [Gemmatimonadales bacterium]|nr:penicillin acylase family protein [Gemmatimonadales bacterium]
MHALLLILTAVAPAAAPRPTDPELARWERHARAVTIVRDDWGIAHVHGTTDADAVFGMIYAQAEDDFSRIETNYLTNIGRLAEAEGESAIYQDLRMKLFVNPDSMRARYAASPAWLKRLMDAWADGLNFYLRTHPEVKPRVLTRFEPWMPLTFSEGSIGGDIESISLDGLQAFYGDTAGLPAVTGLGEAEPSEPTGSNAFAIAPANTVNHRALLLINPHTSFFFRSELQVTSDEGLRAYGAATWGQFFLYQGFIDRLGWMHSSTGADAIDEYAEAIVRHGDRLFYHYGKGERPVAVEQITVPYRTATGQAVRAFKVYRTHHGPIVRAAEGKWISVRLMQKPVEALSQSYLRTKARTLAEYEKVMALQANSSNNTVYADADGHIAYFHPQFIPRRDDRFDWTRPVDGSDPATEWHGVHGIEDSPHVIDPPNGWIQNTNDWPYSAAGKYSPRRERFPRYMDNAGESPRGLHAIRVLESRKDFTPERLREAAFDSYLTAFAALVPPLLAAYDSLPSSDQRRARLAEQIAALRGWDCRWSATSVPTALAVYWGDTLATLTRGSAAAAGLPVYDYMVKRATPAERLGALEAASGRLTRDFGSWRTPWGEINRFQRMTGALVQPFDDAAPSIPVPFTSARWGSLASYGARTYPGTKRMYGTYGNTFVAVVEFGRDSVRAMAVTAGGESGDPKSPHFNDQAERYATGALRPVYFYPEQLRGHTERTYRPGEN